jgi:hypothetical protein
LVLAGLEEGGGGAGDEEWGLEATRREERAGDRRARAAGERRRRAAAVNDKFRSFSRKSVYILYPFGRSLQVLLGFSIICAFNYRLYTYAF